MLNQVLDPSALMKKPPPRFHWDRDSDELAGNFRKLVARAVSAPPIGTRLPMLMDVN